jgi:thiol-disulfide isomerase/thioredoxin
MALMESETLSLGSAAPEFALPGTDGETYSFDSFPDSKTYVVMFICNHCPYVQAIEDRLLDLGRELGPKGAAFFGVMSNDVASYPADHPDRMREQVLAKGYPFPYLYDENQDMARAYGAVCTPDIFVFDGERKLAYHGRVDDNWKDASAVTRHELRDALNALLAGDKPSDEQLPTIGCSLKWKV